MEEEKQQIVQVFDKIAEQTEATSDDQVYVLELDGIQFRKFTPELARKLQKYTSLQMLSLNNCGLTTLEGFPHLIQLIRLDLVANEIKDNDIQYLAPCRHLQTLFLSQNQIKEVNCLTYIQHFNELFQLDLYGNPNNEEKDYQKKIFQLFPKLEILDKEDKLGKFVHGQTMNLAVQRVPSHLFEKQKQTSKAQQKVIKRVSSMSMEDVHKKPLQLPIIKKPTTQQQKKDKNEEAKVQQKAQPIKEENQQQQRKQLDYKSKAPVAKGKGINLNKKTSMSDKCGLIFPCGRIARYLKRDYPEYRIAQGARVYLSAILEYLAAELLEIAGNSAKANKKIRIMPVNIKNALRNDHEFSQFLGGRNCSISEAGLIATNILSLQNQM